MIKSTADMKVEQVVGLKNGKGVITMMNFFEEEDFLGKGRLYAKTIMEPGNSVGYHSHSGDQEAYFILKGKAIYNGNGEVRELTSGDLAICKDGDSHSIEAIGEESLEYIALILYN
ncbi:MAG: cupin domain-containing protein [Clostridiaceae bacterium]